MTLEVAASQLTASDQTAAAVSRTRATPLGLGDKQGGLDAGGPRSPEYVAAKPRPQQIKLVTAHRLAESVPATPGWICERLGVAAQGRPTLLAGYGGTGKSLLALELALAVAGGIPVCWGGVPIALRGPVAWLDYEMGAEHTGIRLNKLADGCGLDLSVVGDDLQFAVLPAPRLTDASASGELERIMTGRALLVIDSFRAASDGDEQDSRMRRVLDELTRLTDVTGCSVIVLVHETKMSEQMRARGRLQAVRGSGAITDAASCVLSLAVAGGRIEIAPTKSACGALPAPLSVRIVDDPAGGLRIVAATAERRASPREAPLSNLAKDLLAVLEESSGPRAQRGLWTGRSGGDVRKALDELERRGLARAADAGWTAVRGTGRDVPRPAKGAESP